METENESPEDGGPPRHVVGVGLERTERELLVEICKEQGVILHAAEEVRELLPMLVNVACNGIVMGDRKPSGGAKAFEVNLATLKRLRSHRRGGELPVLYLVHWPVREHVMKLAQLGVRDVVGQPACEAYVEQRIDEFVAQVKQRPPQRQGS